MWIVIWFEFEYWMKMRLLFDLIAIIHLMCVCTMLTMNPLSGTMADLDEVKLG